MNKVNQFISNKFSTDNVANAMLISAVAAVTAIGIFTSFPVTAQPAMERITLETIVVTAPRMHAELMDTIVVTARRVSI